MSRADLDTETLIYDKKLKEIALKAPVTQEEHLRACKKAATE